jgi:hypothetical protein
MIKRTRLRTKRRVIGLFYDDYTEEKVGRRKLEGENAKLLLKCTEKEGTNE